MQVVANSTLAVTGADSQIKPTRTVLLCATVLIAVGVMAIVSCSSNSTATPAATTPVTTPVTNPITLGLWIANGTNVVEFAPAQLTAGTSDPAPQLVNNSSVFGVPQGVTFDSNGNLWVIDGGTIATGGTAQPALYEFTSAQLAALGTNNA